MMKKFTKEDYDAFAGVEEEPHQPAMMGEIEIEFHGVGVIVVDTEGVQIFVQDGLGQSWTWVFGGKYELNLLVAMALVDGKPSLGYLSLLGFQEV
jgi:hypothetical protein